MNKKLIAIISNLSGQEVHLSFEIGRPRIQNPLASLFMPADKPVDFSDLGRITRQRVLFQRAVGRCADVPALLALIKRLGGNSALNSWEEAVLLNTFKDRGAWDELIQLYESSPHADFKESGIMTEFYIVALNKSGLAEKAITKAQERVDQGLGNGEVLAQLGKAFKKTDPAKAYDYYLKGFLLDFDYYPGINAVYLLNAQGQSEKAEMLAELVYLSTLNAGGVASEDYWCLITMVEAGCLGRYYQDPAQVEKLDQVLSKVVRVAQNAWEIETTLDNLGALMHKRDAEHEDITYLAKVIEALQDRLRVIQAKSQNAGHIKSNAQQKKTQTADLVKGSGFHFQGLNSNFIAGNYKFYGQLHDVVVSRTDIRMTRLLLSALGLDQEVDVKVFNQRIDQLLRAQFETSQMEDIKGQRHRIFDAFTVRLRDRIIEGLDLDQFPMDEISSGTNIISDFFLGMGDCRHHAYLKQLGFDLWKRDQINRQFKVAYQALENGAIETYNEAIQQIRNLQSKQMMVCDVAVFNQIKTDGPYSPIMIDGKPVFQEELSFIEEHTLNVVITTNEQGDMLDVVLADAFYQEHYDWAYAPGKSVEVTRIPEGQVHVSWFMAMFRDYNRVKWNRLIDLGILKKHDLEIASLGELSTAAALANEGIDPQKFQTILNEPQIIYSPASVASITNEKEFMKSNLVLVPTAYAGKRDRPSNNEFEQLRVRDVVVGMPAKEGVIHMLRSATARVIGQQPSAQGRQSIEKLIQDLTED